MRQHDGRTEFYPPVGGRDRSDSFSFQPHACYSVAADVLYIYALNVPTYRVPIDESTTVLISALDQESFAGIVLKGVRSLVGGDARAATVTVRRVVESAIAARPEILWHMAPRDLRTVRDHVFSLR